MAVTERRNVALERIGPSRLRVTNPRVGQKSLHENGSRVDDITVTFEVRFPDGPAGDDARAVLPEVVRRSHDRLCPVGRTVETATPIVTRTV